MNPDQFSGGADFSRIVADIRRDLDNLTAQVKQVPGVPITRASSAFFIPSASEPDPPASGAYLYVEGNVVRVRTPSIDYSTLPPEVPLIDPVANAPAIISGTGPATYNSTWGGHMYDGLVALKDTVNQLLAELREAGYLAS